MPSPRPVVPTRFKELSRAELQELILCSTGMRQLSETLKMRNVHYSLLRTRIEEENLDVSSWKRNRKGSSAIARTNETLRRKARLNFETNVLPFLFVRNSKFSGKKARGYIGTWNKVYGWFAYRCEMCGNEGSWLGGNLSLQIDHKNGESTDHRLENLRYLCPNCHSTTDTFTGRNTARRRKLREKGPFV